MQRHPVAVIGAGPQALAITAFLVRAGLSPDDIAVFDPAGRWLAAWDGHFDRLAIRNLRSPSVHHPHPDAWALSRFARSKGRGAELVHRYGLPSTSLFADFCAHLIRTEELDACVRAARVTSVSRTGEFRTDDGHEHRAGHVVWATNPAIAGVRQPPVADGAPRLHAWTDDTAALASPTPGGRAPTVAVVGGGLTAAHLVAIALARGAHVEWVTRRPVTERNFDTDPGWLGPKELRGFEAQEDPRRRLEMVIEARNGGTVPGWMLRKLRSEERSGRLCRRVGDVVIDTDSSTLLVDDGPVAADEVWLATGDRPDITASAPLERLCLELDVERVGGRPVLERSLRLPGSVVHVAGRLAQLEIGPAAGNLFGARRAAERVVASVVGADALKLIPSS